MENKGGETIGVEPKAISEPHPNPQNSIFGPKKAKNELNWRKHRKQLFCWKMFLTLTLTL